MSDIADFIDRNEFMRLVQEAYQKAAEKAGTHFKDIVPVVRCKDCIHSCHKNVFGIDCIFCTYGVCLACEVEDGFFCSMGERREDEAD